MNEPDQASNPGSIRDSFAIGFVQGWAALIVLITVEIFLLFAIANDNTVEQIAQLLLVVLVAALAGIVVCLVGFGRPQSAKGFCAAIGSFIALALLLVGAIAILFSTGEHR
jgi:hypothetical protein